MPEGVIMSLGVKSPPGYSKPFEEWLVKARLLVPYWGALAHCGKGQKTRAASLGFRAGSVMLWRPGHRVVLYEGRMQKMNGVFIHSEKQTLDSPK